MVAPNQLEHGQDSSCPPLLSDTRPYWPRKHDVQGTFKAKSLHETTTWTSRDIEIISKTRWSEPELGKFLRWPCRDSSGFLNLHGNRTIFSARWLGGLWNIDLLNSAWFIVLVSKNWHKLYNHNFLLLIPINLLIAFIWLHWQAIILRTSGTIIPDTEVWKWNCLSVGATSQDLGCLVKWRVPLVDELDFEELALNMESLYAKQTRNDFCCSK